MKRKVSKIAVKLCRGIAAAAIMYIGGAVFAAKRTTQFTFWTSQVLHSGFMIEAAESWNAEHPNDQIVLKADIFPYKEVHSKLLTALQSGKGAPDLSDIEIGMFANYIKDKKPPLVPLNDIIEKEKSKFIMSRFDSYKKDGKYYGIDYHVGASVIYYNKEILDEAGVDADRIITWNDYYEAGKKVVEATGKPMCTIEAAEQWSFHPLIVQQGGDFLDANNKGTLDSEVNIKTLEFLKKLVDEKVAVVAPGGYHHSSEYWSFMNKGGAASVWMPLWYMGRFTSYMPRLKGKMIVRPLPRWKAGGARSAGMGGTGTVITAQCKNIDLAKRFLYYAKCSKEGSKKTWTMLGFDPIRWDVWSDPAMKASNQYTNYFGTGVFDMLLSIKDEIRGVNVTEKYPLAQAIVRREVLSKVFEKNSASPRELLVKANKLLNASN